MLEIILFGIAFAATAAGIAVFRRYGTSGRLLDVPNERSSHAAPKLRGAGIVIVGVCLILYLATTRAVAADVAWSYVTGALIVAGVSWVDDVRSLPASIRFAAHAAAAIILIAGCGPSPSLYVPIYGSTIDLGLLAPALTFLWIVWMINAYNFMDGIDGIAGAQAVVAGLGWAALGAVFGQPVLYLFGGILVFSSLGFLIHNWDPAAVFMGDVGSAFLGYTFASMPLLVSSGGTVHEGWLLPASICFLWLFIADTAFTFVRRVFKKEKFWTAHRQHFYQRLVISGSSHSTVTLIYTGLALFAAASLIAAFIARGFWEILLLISLVLPAAVILGYRVEKKFDLKDTEC